MTRLSPTLFSLSLVILSAGLQLNAEDTPTMPNLFESGNMNDFTEQVNPWGGVDAAGNLHGLTSSQIAVDDNGRIGGVDFSPSVAVGDLNGDGLLDLVVADPKGFFWFYANHGTKLQPKFTNGEVMPIWLGSLPKPKGSTEDTNPNHNVGGPTDHLVPRIQLVDFDGDGALDIVAGTFPGLLYYIHNDGSTAQPNFSTPKDLNELKSIPLRSDGRLDCNYLSPFLYDFFQDGRLDLIRGDGTYSANSVFLFRNKGSNAAPVFNESNQIKIIPGMGREHLTPHVVDWNNDGKPDIITGERTGQIEVFLNTSQDPANPTFDQGQKLKFGGKDTFGNFTSVTTGSFSGNPKVPDVIFSNDTGEIFLCRNTGTPGAPKFTLPPEPFKGVNPYPKILVPSSWALGWWDSFYTYTLHGWSEGAPYGVPYEVLEVTNAQKEQGFAPPQGVTWKNALKYELLDRKSVYFKDAYYPKAEDETQQHSIDYTKRVPLDSETDYEVTFWIKGDGVHDVTYAFHGGQTRNPGTDDRDINFFDITKPVSLSSSWSQVDEIVSWNTTNGHQHDSVNFGFSFNFYGQGHLYMADIQVHKKQ
jgi:hypothetical protein